MKHETITGKAMLQPAQFWFIDREEGEAANDPSFKSKKPETSFVNGVNPFEGKAVQEVFLSAKLSDNAHLFAARRGNVATFPFRSN